MPRKSRIRAIRISIVAPSGEKVEELVRPIDIAKRQLNTEAWDKDKAIRRFAHYVARCDVMGMIAAYNAILRHRCLTEALEACAIGRRPNIKKLKALLSLWNIHSYTLGACFALFSATIKRFAPPYQGGAVRLYRGQNLAEYEQGMIGMAWTGRIEQAEVFALRNAPGFILELDATPDMIIARLPDHISTPKTDPKNGFEFEDEYLVDPRAITGKVRKI